MKTNCEIKIKPLLNCEPKSKVEKYSIINGRVYCDNNFIGIVRKIENNTITFLTLRNTIAYIYI